MQDEQGRDYPSVPAMPEVAVQSDGGLRRPAREAARPATTTALEAAFRCGLEQLSDSPAQLVLSPPPAHPNRPSHLYRRVERGLFSHEARARRAPDSLTPANRASPSSTEDNPSRTVRDGARHIFACPGVSPPRSTAPIRTPCKEHMDTRPELKRSRTPLTVSLPDDSNTT